MGAQKEHVTFTGSVSTCVLSCFCHVLTLCDPTDCSSPGSSVQGILQGRILEWVANSSGSSQPRDQTCVSVVSCIGKCVLYRSHHLETPTRSESESEVAQSCLTLWDPMDCSLPGFSVHGILQASVLEWVAISFSRGSSCPRDQTQVSRTAGRHFIL